jgi:type IV pilus assembly protein PilM
LFGRSKVSAGLDIGQNTVRWAAVEAGSGRVKELWAGELVPARQQKHDVLEGEALERRLRELLGQCQKQVSSWARSVATSVQGGGTICGYMELPKLTDKELKTAVPSKLARQLPFPIDEVLLSHVNVPPLSEDKEKSAVVYVAVQKKVVEQRTALLKSAGLDARGLEVPPIPLARAYAKNHDHARDELVALVAIGYQLTQVVITRQGFPYYHRQFSSAGAEATYAFQMGSQSDWKSAEAFKLGYDVNQKQVAIEPFINKWTGEVKRTLDSFIARQAPNAKIARVSLMGGGARWPGLDRRLGETLALPVAVETWDRMKVDAGAQKVGDAAAFSLAIGLALPS